MFLYKYILNGKDNLIPSSDFIQIFVGLNNCQLVVVNNGLSLIT